MVCDQRRPTVWNIIVIALVMLLLETKANTNNNSRSVDVDTFTNKNNVERSLATSVLDEKSENYNNSENDYLQKVRKREYGYRNPSHQSVIAKREHNPRANFTEQNEKVSHDGALETAKETPPRLIRSANNRQEQTAAYLPSRKIDWTDPEQVEFGETMPMTFDDRHPIRATPQQSLPLENHNYAPSEKYAINPDKQLRNILDERNQIPGNLHEEHRNYAPSEKYGIKPDKQLRNVLDEHNQVPIQVPQNLKRNYAPSEYTVKRNSRIRNAGSIRTNQAPFQQTSPPVEQHYNAPSQYFNPNSQSRNAQDVYTEENDLIQPAQMSPMDRYYPSNQYFKRKGEIRNSQDNHVPIRSTLPLTRRSFPPVEPRYYAQNRYVNPNRQLRNADHSNKDNHRISEAKHQDHIDSTYSGPIRISPSGYYPHEDAYFMDRNGVIHKGRMRFNPLTRPLLKGYHRKYRTLPPGYSPIATTPIPVVATAVPVAAKPVPVAAATPVPVVAKPASVVATPVAIVATPVAIVATPVPVVQELKKDKRDKPETKPASPTTAKPKPGDAGANKTAANSTVGEAHLYEVIDKSGSHHTEINSCGVRVESANSTEEEDKVKKKMLKEIITELEGFKGHSSKGVMKENSPCSILGSWTSEAGGVRFDINTTTQAGVLNVTVATTIPPKKDPWLNGSEWRIEGETPLCDMGIFTLTAIHKTQHRTAVFTGQCLRCGGEELVAGVWATGRVARDCRDTIVAYGEKPDVFRKEVLHILRAQKQKELASKANHTTTTEAAPSTEPSKKVKRWWEDNED